ncbi:MAG: hypothetical protein KDD53_09200, partial [Bdellovibrionales bacterium]|nr:hypothetical protein [Bdellovibrionales bacterium]
MNVLVVDANVLAGRFYSEKIESFSSRDIELLDIALRVVDCEEYLQKIHGADVLIIGSRLLDSAAEIATNARNLMPDLEILLFVSEDGYSQQTVHRISQCGIRKILSDTSDPVNLLQEFSAIYAKNQRSGKFRGGKIVVLTQTKGSAGATTLTASLGEISARSGAKTLLWDLDIETRDLTRALCTKIPN